MSQQENVTKEILYCSNQMHVLALRQADYVRALHLTAVRVITGLATMVLLPNYRTSQMRRTGRRLSPEVTRLQGHLRYPDFERDLKSRCQSQDVLLGMFDESYTTAVCSNCGAWNRNVGAKKVVQCPVCHHRECRDGGAAATFLKKCLQIATHYSTEVLEAAKTPSSSAPCTQVGG
jgi:hypothetical protein